MDFSPIGFRNAYKSVRTAIRKEILDSQGFYIKEFTPEQQKAMKKGFEPYSCHRVFVGGDTESILPSGTRVLTHKDYHVDVHGKLDPDRTHITKKITKKDGQVLLSEACKQGVDIYECTSTGPEIWDIKNKKKIFSSKNK